MVLDSLFIVYREKLYEISKINPKSSIRISLLDITPKGKLKNIWSFGSNSVAARLLPAMNGAILQLSLVY
jgi:hypothetical protein